MWKYSKIAGPVLILFTLSCSLFYILHSHNHQSYHQTNQEVSKHTTEESGIKSWVISEERKKAQEHRQAHPESLNKATGTQSSIISDEQRKPQEKSQTKIDFEQNKKETGIQSTEEPQNQPTTEFDEAEQIGIKSKVISEERKRAQEKNHENPNTFKGLEINSHIKDQAKNHEEIHREETGIKSSRSSVRKYAQHNHPPPEDQKKTTRNVQQQNSPKEAEGIKETHTNPGSGIKSRIKSENRQDVQDNSSFELEEPKDERGIKSSTISEERNRVQEIHPNAHHVMSEARREHDEVQKNSEDFGIHSWHAQGHIEK